MRLTRFVQTLGLFLGLGLASFVVGCGSGAKQGPTAEASKAIAEDVRKGHQQLKAARAGVKGGLMSKGRGRSGP